MKGWAWMAVVSGLFIFALGYFGHQEDRRDYQVYGVCMTLVGVGIGLSIEEKSKL